MSLSTKEIAEVCNNLDTGYECRDLNQIASDNNVMIICGYSDDITMIHGDLYEETNNGTFYLNENEVMHPDYYEEMFEDSPDGSDKWKKLISDKMKCKAEYHQIYTCEIPCKHESFNMKDVDTIYGKGYVICLDDLREYIANKSQ
jgi:hypothetical protein